MKRPIGIVTLLLFVALAGVSDGNRAEHTLRIRVVGMTRATLTLHPPTSGLTQSLDETAPQQSSQAEVYLLLDWYHNTLEGYTAKLTVERIGSSSFSPMDAHALDVLTGIPGTQQAPMMITFHLPLQAGQAKPGTVVWTITDDG